VVGLEHPGGWQAIVSAKFVRPFLSPPHVYEISLTGLQDPHSATFADNFSSPTPKCAVLSQHRRRLVKAWTPPFFNRSTLLCVLTVPPTSRPQ